MSSSELIHYRGMYLGRLAFDPERSLFFFLPARRELRKIASLVWSDPAEARQALQSYAAELDLVAGEPQR